MSRELQELFRRANRCPEEAEMERADELDMLERRGLATWDDIAEAHQIRRRRAIREHRRATHAQSEVARAAERGRR